MARTKRRPHDQPGSRSSAESVKSALIEPAQLVTAPQEPLWRPTPSAAIEIGSLLLLPLIAFLAIRFVPINQNGFLDPYVYTGYINDFKELLARYGLTYYSVRFGMIVPAQFFAHLLGPEGGFFAFRYVLALTAGIPIYYVVKHHFSQPVAALTVAALLTSPSFARVLLWDYPDSAGVPYLLAAVCMVLLQDRASLWRDSLAGAFAAMAINCNFFELAPLGIFAATWLFFSLSFRRSPANLAKRAGGFALGGLIVFVLGCIYYWHAVGKVTNIFLPTMRMVSSLANGGTKQWRTAGISWIAQRIYVLIPVLLGICSILSVRWRRASFTSLVVVSFGVLLTAFYYVEQFWLDSDILQLFYYFSYLLPVVFLMLAFLWQALWEGIKVGSIAFIGVGMAVLLAPWMIMVWGGYRLPDPTASQWLTFAGVVVVVMFLATRTWSWRPIQIALPWLALVLLAGCFTAGLAYCRSVVGVDPSVATTERDVYRIALQFLRAVPRVADHPGKIKFWYSNRPGAFIDSVQSTHLWGYSKLNETLPQDPGLPHLGELQFKLLSDPQLRYIGLLCESEEELSRGTAALTQAGVGFNRVEDHVLASGRFRIYFELLQVTHGPSARTTPQ